MGSPLHLSDQVVQVAWFDKQSALLWNRLQDVENLPFRFESLIPCQQDHSNCPMNR